MWFTVKIMSSSSWLVLVVFITMEVNHWWWR